MYCSLIELNILYPNGAGYDTPTQLNSQNLSFDLVNSFLNSELSVGNNTTTSQGTTKTPGILKIAQGKFYQYILESGNVGYTDELNNLYNATAEMLSKVTQNELTLPGVTKTSANVGYTITYMSQQKNKGVCFVAPGSVPSFPVMYKLVFTADGNVRSGNAKYSVFRGDDLTNPLVTNQPATYMYDNILRNMAYTSNLYSLESLCILFDGEWSNTDVIYIEGVPSQEINTVNTQAHTIQQGRLVY